MAGFLPDSFIQRVLDETDVVSLIDSYIPLQKKGKDHWSLCPFCEDGNNPSFSVSSQKQFYYCFRCRASGNAIGFLMNYQSKDFLDAVETLAANAGLELPKKIHGESFEKYKKIKMKLTQMLLLLELLLLLLLLFLLAPFLIYPNHQV